MRQLSSRFVKTLTGELKNLLDCVVQDKELDMQIRDGYVNVYYHGGNILRIKPRSFEFDEMYYNDPSVMRSTYARKDAIIHKQLSASRDELIKLLPNNPQEYFRQAKAAMDEWAEKLSDIAEYEEKKEQQQIALANRCETDYVVLDLEYAVSRNSAFAYNGDKKKVVPRFDIIAIGNGQIVVIELKKGLGATPGKSGIGPHIDCYDHTIGRDNGGLFVKEMRELLAQKQEFGLLDSKLKITKERPKFIFAFSDEDGKDEFGKFLDRLPEAYKASAIYLDKNHKLVSKKESSMNTAFSEQERKHHLALLADPQKHEELFENAKGEGCWWNRDEQRWDHSPHILKHENSVCNLYAPIRQMALNYFERHDIAWWQQDTDRYFPTGNLLSSQNHCLNHLMAIQRDKKAVMAMIKAICPTITDIYPSPIDSNVEIKDGKLHRFNSYITFEFTCDNRNLLHESGDKRGKKCTSVDALVYAKDKNKGNVLIPIEWKYTESYEKTPKKRAHQESVKRYVDLANLKSSNLKEWILDYEWDPLYEFARQELLMERIIAKKPLCGFGYKKKALEANDFIHVVVRPNENAEIIEDIAAFRKTIVDESKLIEIDPQTMLAPLKKFDEYKDLISYLQTRYWKK